MDKFWIIDMVIDGERVQEFFNQETADFARFFALNQKLVNRLDTRTMRLKKEGGGR